VILSVITDVTRTYRTRENVCTQIRTHQETKYLQDKMNTDRAKHFNKHSLIKSNVSRF